MECDVRISFASDGACFIVWSRAHAGRVQRGCRGFEFVLIVGTQEAAAMQVIREDHPLKRLFSGLIEQAFNTDLGICSPELTDYLSNLLVSFVHVDRLQAIRDAEGRRLPNCAVGRPIAITSSTTSPRASAPTRSPRILPARIACPRRGYSIGSAMSSRPASTGCKRYGTAGNNVTRLHGTRAASFSTSRSGLQYGTGLQGEVWHRFAR